MDEDNNVPVNPYEPDSGLKVLGIFIGRPGVSGLQDALLAKRVTKLEKWGYPSQKVALEYGCHHSCGPLHA